MDGKWRFHYIEVIISGNELFLDKEDTSPEEFLMALLNKNFDFQRPSKIGELKIKSSFIYSIFDMLFLNINLY